MSVLLLHIIIRIPIKISGRLRFWPILRSKVSSKGTWFSFKNPIRNLCVKINEETKAEQKAFVILEFLPISIKETR